VCLDAELARERGREGGRVDLLFLIFVRLIHSKKERETLREGRDERESKRETYIRSIETRSSRNKESQKGRREGGKEAN